LISAIALSTCGKYQAPTPFFGEAITPHPVTKTQLARRKIFQRAADRGVPLGLIFPLKQRIDESNRMRMEYPSEPIRRKAGMVEQQNGGIEAARHKDY
jgi:hypothetical protein